MTSKIFSTFAGTYVSLVMRTLKARTQERIGNLQLAGYLLEECDDFFYLGETPEEVTAAINKKDVAAVLSAIENDIEFELPEDSEIQ